MTPVQAMTLELEMLSVNINVLIKDLQDYKVLIEDLRRDAKSMQ